MCILASTMGNYWYLIPSASCNGTPFTNTVNSGQITPCLSMYVGGYMGGSGLWRERWRARQGDLDGVICRGRSLMGRGVVRYTLGEKIAIAREAYDEPGKVYRTSQKYGVDYRQIKRWRTLLDKEDVRHGAKVYRPASSIRQRTGLAGMPTAYRLLVFGMARDLVGGAPAIEINVTPPVTLDGLIAKVRRVRTRQARGRAD